MTLILLAGNSRRNHDWIRSVNTALRPMFDDTYIHDYEHWHNGRPMIDFDEELSLLREMFGPDEPVTIFAKSVGTVLAMKAISANIFSPVRCIFTGFPLSLALSTGLDTKRLLCKYQAPIMLIQNSNDPLGSYEDVKSYFATRAQQLIMVGLPGEKHSYDDIDTLKLLTKKFITA